LLRVLRGHDEPEMIPVAFAAAGEGVVVCIIVFSTDGAQQVASSGPS
jgi:hypothetical protein